MSKYTKMVSPKGPASYPKITRPDQKYNNYQAGVILSDEEYEDMLEKMKDIFIDECGPKKVATATFPFKKNEEGKWVFKATSKSKPRIYDSKGKPVLDDSDLNVASGSIIKVSFSATVKQDRTGVTAYLNGVQIIEYVEYAGNDFQAEEGSFVAEEPSSAPETTSVANEEVDF